MQLERRQMLRAASWGFVLGIGLTAARDVAANSPRARLGLRIANLRNNTGLVGCALFASEQGFPKDETSASQTRRCPVVNKQALCAFEAVAAGTYAAVCFHDENANGRLDTGFLGIPTEGVAVSNDAEGFMGPPKWEDARFHFTGQDSVLVLHTSY
jgi:uncharacterized protein (DUF2141 family)